jgi:hypothetical protein
MNRYDILKNKKPRSRRKNISIPETDKKPFDPRSEALLLSIHMMEWFQRRNIEFNRSNFSVIDFRKEFCTFRFGMPRRAGNTTLAMRIFQHYSNPIFIGITQDILNDLRQHRFPLNFERRGASIYSIGQNEGVFRGLSADAVIVDMASYINPQHLEKIYLINSEAFFLIG